MIAARKRGNRAQPPLDALRTDLKKPALVPQDGGRKRPAILAVGPRGQLGVFITIGTDEDAPDDQARRSPAKYSPMRIAEVLSRLDGIHGIILALANLTFNSLLIRHAHDDRGNS